MSLDQFKGVIKKTMKSDPRGYNWRVLYLCLMTALLYGLYSHWVYDDPFITYRYAENLAHGNGMVYNPGERVLSTTTPLFAGLLAGFSFVWSDLPRLANLIGCVSIAAGGVLLWEISSSWNLPMIGWAGLFLYPTNTLLLSTLGSETPLYLAIILGLFVAYIRGKYELTAFLAALLFLTRADGILVAALFGAHFLLLVRRPVPWKAVGLYLAILLAWIGLSWAYFGSPLPVTLAAKQYQGAMQNSQRFAAGFLTMVRGYSAAWEYWVEAALAVIGLIFMLWKARPWSFFMGWTFLYFAAYSALGVSRYFWYYAPLVPGFIGSVALGLELVVQSIRQTLSKISRVNQSPRIQALPAVLLLLPLVLAQLQNTFEFHLSRDPRAEAYPAVGEWLDQNAPPHSLVGTLEVGMIGYYSHRRMLDFAGLIQPQVGRHLVDASSYDEVAVWAVENYHPDYLVLQDGHFSQLEAAYVKDRCTVKKRFPGKEYHYTSDLTIYACL